MKKLKNKWWIDSNGHIGGLEEVERELCNLLNAGKHFDQTILRPQISLWLYPKRNRLKELLGAVRAFEPKLHFQVVFLSPEDFSFGIGVSDAHVVADIINARVQQIVDAVMDARKQPSLSIFTVCFDDSGRSKGD